MQLAPVKKRRRRGVHAFLAENLERRNQVRRGLPSSIYGTAREKPKGGDGPTRQNQGGIHNRFFRDQVIPEKMQVNGFGDGHQTNLKNGNRPRDQKKQQQIDELREIRQMQPMSLAEKVKCMSCMSCMYTCFMLQ